MHKRAFPHLLIGICLRKKAGEAELRLGELRGPARAGGGTSREETRDDTQTRTVRVPLRGSTALGTGHWQLPAQGAPTTTPAPLQSQSLLQAAPVL